MTGWTVLAGCGKTTLACENLRVRTCGTTAEHSHRILKKAGLLTHPTPARQDAPCPRQGRSKRSLTTLLRGGWDDPNCARHSHPPTHWHAETCHLPWRGPSDFLYLSWREWPRLPFTGHIERAHSYRARSVSKKGTWPLLPHLSQAARCASTGGRPSYPTSFFSILLESGQRLMTISRATLPLGPKGF